MKILRLLLFAGGTLCLMGPVAAKPWWVHDADTGQNDFLPPDEAFRVSARVDGEVIRVRWVIADGYYLYRQRMEVKAESPDLVLSPANFPRGITKTDPYLGTQEIFKQQVESTAAFARSDAGAHSLEIRLTYQGCAEAGLCYPPINKVLFPSAGDPGAAGAPDRTYPVAATGATVRIPPNPWIGYAIGGGGLAFFLAGLLLRKGRRLALPA